MLVAGTATEVGKTWVACALIRRLREDGARVAARKPAQSYDPGDPGPTDAEALAAATGASTEAVCTSDRTYPLPMAPPMAAEALGRTPATIAELAGGLSWPSGTDVGIVESAGGVRSPLAADGDTVDLVRAIRPDLVVLVADAGLGTINAVRSVAPALADWPLAVLLNRYEPSDELHRRNREWLAERERLSVHVDLEAIVGLLLTARR